MLIPEFYDQWADRMEDYLNEINEELNCIIDRIHSPTRLQSVGTTTTNPDVARQEE